MRVHPKERGPSSTFEPEHRRLDDHQAATARGPGRTDSGSTSAALVPECVAWSTARDDLSLDIEQVVMNLVSEPVGEHENRPLVTSAADSCALPLALVETTKQCLEGFRLLLELAQYDLRVLRLVGTDFGQFGKSESNVKHWVVLGEDSSDAFGEEVCDVAKVGQVLQ